jgi:hypothetical protein
VAVDAWATVTVAELNVRSAADIDATSRYRLVRGAVVHVAEGPVSADGFNWYRVASLGGALGWAASGPAAEPFLTTLVDDPTLIRCGEVKRPVFDIVDGAPMAHDPLAIGDMAVPVAAFSDLELGAIELLRGIGGEACFTAQIGPDGRPTVQSQLNVGACGRPVSDGNFFRIRPAAGQSAAPENQVKDPAVIHPAILAGDAPDDPMSANLQARVRLAASGAGATVCVNAGVSEDAQGVHTYLQTDGLQCVIADVYAFDYFTVRPASGGEPIVFAHRLGGDHESVQIGIPTALYITASTSESEPWFYFWQGTLPGCE